MENQLNTPGMREFASGYYVTCDGRVFTKRYGRLIQMKPSVTKGYLWVRVVMPNGTRKVWRINRAVACAWIGSPPSPKHEARHKDGNRRNNTVENLAWATTRENAADRLSHGTQTLGNGHPNSKLTAGKVALIRSSKDADSVLAHRFGVSVDTVRYARKGRSWKHVSVPTVTRNDLSQRGAQVAAGKALAAVLRPIVEAGGIR